VGDFSGSEVLTDGKMMHMGMMDRGFTVAVEEWVIFLVICKCPLPFHFHDLYLV
jgi:hypothetical protein